MRIISIIDNYQCVLCKDNEIIYWFNNNKFRMLENLIVYIHNTHSMSPKAAPQY